MKVDLIYLAVLAGLFFYGFNIPFVLAMLYVFLDFLPYQHISWWIFPAIPFPKIFAVAFFLSFFLFELRKAVKPGAVQVLLALFLVWITLTCTWAVAPSATVWSKWDWVFKSIFAATFISLVLTSRERAEGLLWVIVFSIGATIMVAGLKGLFGGGGYGSLRRLVPVEVGITESSTLGTVCAAMLPIIAYLVRHNTLLPQHYFVRWGLRGLMMLVPFAVVATYARSGLVALGCWAAIAWLGTRHKLRWLALGTVALLVASPYLSESWLNRMNTISNYEEEGSAAGRVAVWLWTIDFASRNPLGGGFDSYVVNGLAGFKNLRDGAPVVTDGLAGGKAYHSIYFELLGEQGYVGLALYLLVHGLIVTKLLRLFWSTRGVPGMEWMHDLAYAIFVSMLVYHVGGAFVGIAYQAWTYLLISLVLGLDHIARQQTSGRRLSDRGYGTAPLVSQHPAVQGVELGRQ